MRKIRIGIELDHVLRNVNKQIVKYYQQDFDESIDVDDVDYKDDVLHSICKFKNKSQLKDFLYETYPLEIFGHASQMSRGLSRDLNDWIKSLTNEEDYEFEVFLYSLGEFDITIQSTYFFLSKIASRSRIMLFPRSISELSKYGDVFITSNKDVVNKSGKPTFLIKMNFNKDAENVASYCYEDLKSFLNDEDKLNKIIKITDTECKVEKGTKEGSLLTWMRSSVSSLLKKIGM